jgi:hypothetical protein
MLLAYVLIFLLHLSASTCYATSRNQHLLFAGRADDATALLPAAIHHHHHGHTAKAAEVPTCTPIAARSILAYALRSRHDFNLDQACTHALYDMQVLPDYSDVRHYHPAMMARWGGGAPPRPPSPSVELAGIGGLLPPPPSLSAVEPSGVEGAPPPPSPAGKQDTSAAMEPSPSPMPSSPHGEGASSSSDASATEQEASAASDDVDVDADYDGPMTHPPSHN